VRAWQHEEAAKAVRAWFEESGRLPTWTEWEKASDGRPSARTIQRRWGWHELLADAIGGSTGGVRDVMEWKAGYGGLHWSSSRILAALELAGRKGWPPTWQEWEKADESGRPTAKTVSRRFGGWGAALALAGLDATPRLRSELWQRKRSAQFRARMEQGPTVPRVLLRRQVQDRLRRLGFASLEEYVERRYVGEGLSQVALAVELFGRATRSGRPEIARLLDALGLAHRPRGGPRPRRLADR
jgi:hypothetical protein